MGDFAFLPVRRGRPRAPLPGSADEELFSSIAVIQVAAVEYRDGLSRRLSRITGAPNRHRIPAAQPPQRRGVLARENRGTPANAAPPDPSTLSRGGALLQWNHHLKASALARLSPVTACIAFQNHAAKHQRQTGAYCNGRRARRGRGRSLVFRPDSGKPRQAAAKRDHGHRTLPLQRHLGVRRRDRLALSASRSWRAFPR